MAKTTPPPDPTDIKLWQPILKASDVRTDIHGGPRRSWTTGAVMVTFFNYNPASSRSLFDAVDEALIPLPPQGAVGTPGNRVWTLPQIEALAYAAFHSDKLKAYDASRLLRTLDVVYSVARLHGMLPSYEDPIRRLRPRAPVRLTGSSHSRKAQP